MAGSASPNTRVQSPPPPACSHLAEVERLPDVAAEGGRHLDHLVSGLDLGGKSKRAAWGEWLEDRTAVQGGLCMTRHQAPLCPHVPSCPHAAGVLAGCRLPAMRSSTPRAAHPAVGVAQLWVGAHNVGAAVVAAGKLDAQRLGQGHLPEGGRTGAARGDALSSCCTLRLGRSAQGSTVTEMLAHVLVWADIGCLAQPTS